MCLSVVASEVDSRGTLSPRSGGFKVPSGSIKPYLVWIFTAIAIIWLLLHPSGSERHEAGVYLLPETQGTYTNWSMLFFSIEVFYPR